ncbi:efflux RND transporter periplasmic adaptor subunit [Halioxenophilus aromaticivorans]
MKAMLVSVALPVLILAGSVAGFVAVNAVAKQESQTVEYDGRPNVRIEPAKQQDYQVIISQFASVQPVEITPLAAQVSGEVTHWHPNFIEGGRVKKGDLLFSVEKDAYESAYLQAEASLNQAKASLIEEQAQADVSADEARRNPNKKYTDLFLRKPQVMSAKASVKSAEAALRIAKRDLENCDVYAPFDALVVESNIGVGQYLSIGSTVATLYSIERAKIVVPIPGFDSQFLPDDLAGTQVTVAGDSLQGGVRKGKILHDLGTIDEETRMTRVLVEVEDPYALQTDARPLRFGSYVEVSFAGKTFHNIVKMPQQLVINRTVWVVNDQSELESRPVQILREEGGSFLINDGLTPSDNVITTLPEYPQAGMKVKVINDQHQGISANTNDKTVTR